MNSNVLIAAIAIGTAGLVGAVFAHAMGTHEGRLDAPPEIRTEYADFTEADYAAMDADELAIAIADGRLSVME